jgi:hypothetical protein
MATHGDFEQVLNFYGINNVDYTIIEYNLYINDQTEFLCKPNKKSKDNDVETSEEYFYVGLYYEIVHINYKLMKKYYQQAIIKFKNKNAFVRLDDYYKNIEKNLMMSDCLFFIIKYPNYRNCFIDDCVFIENVCVIIDNICKLICFEKLDIKNFGGLINFVFKYLKDIPTNILIKSLDEKLNNEEIGTLKYLNKFLVYIGKIKYKKKKDKQSNKLLNLIIRNHPLAIYDCSCNGGANKIGIQELLKIKYGEYLDEKYKPGGNGFIKAKLDFEKHVGQEKEQNNNEQEKE